MPMSGQVRLVDVGPRDGLQNESVSVPTDVKLELIRRLGLCGLPAIEATAFVSPRWVPQMADATAVLSGLKMDAGIDYPVLVPNLKGFEMAKAAGCREVAVFTAASEGFSRRNTNCSIAESLKRFEPVMAEAARSGIRVRGYVSCALGCPYEGNIDSAAACEVALALSALGCYEISLGDTIGVATPASTRRLFEAVSRHIEPERLAGHFHDTYGMAIANVQAGLECGIRVFDCSVAGLGGCPYAPGASGNVATEAVVYLLQGMGIECGVDLDALVDTAAWISAKLGRLPASAVARAILAKRIIN